MLVEQESGRRNLATAETVPAVPPPPWEKRFDGNLGPFAKMVMTALVVEDSPRIAERLVELVSIPGQVEVVSTADTEAAALEACNAHDIDLAIVDLQLAEGTGFGVIRALRAAGRRRHACIVVLTNHAVPALRNAAFEAGADFFLDKSKDFATLPQLIDQLLAGRKN